MIPTFVVIFTKQIADSIQNSRRTIIMLTRDFFDSEWAKMQFHMAYEMSLHKKGARLIIIVCCDLKDIQNKNAELKAYLKAHTYIELGDPRFWMKLRYAMPHPNN